MKGSAHSRGCSVVYSSSSPKPYEVRLPLVAQTFLSVFSSRNKENTCPSYGASLNYKHISTNRSPLRG